MDVDGLGVEMLKNDSKKIGSHKRRQLFWDGYSKIISRSSGMEGAVHCIFRFTEGAEEGEDGELEVVELAKRQRGLVD